MAEDWRAYCILYGFLVTSDEIGSLYIKDVRTAHKIVDEMRLMLEDTEVWNDLKRFTQLSLKFCRWGLLVKGYGFKALPNRVADFIYEQGTEINEEALLLKEQFLKVYKEYCKKRWGNYPIVNTTTLAEKAAQVTDEVAKEFGLSMKQCIEFQHECWDKIDRPLTLKTLANKDKSKRRIEIAIDIKRKNGILWRKEEDIETNKTNNTNTVVDKKAVEINKKWREILKIGVEAWLQVAKETNDIETRFLKKVASIYIKIKQENGEKEAKKLFTQEIVEKLWKELINE